MQAFSVSWLFYFIEVSFFNWAFRHQAEWNAKGFSKSDHFVAMLFCQLAQVKSFRQIYGVFGR